MKFTSKRDEGKRKINLSFLSERRKQTSFTPGFYKFVLAFAIIIVASFGVLVFLGNQAS